MMSQEYEKAPIAQSVEQMTLNHWVQGSSPCGRTIFFNSKSRLKDKKITFIGYNLATIKTFIDEP